MGQGQQVLRQPAAHAAHNSASTTPTTPTSGSKRSLTLPKRAITALKVHKARQDRERREAGEAWHDNDDLVFCHGWRRIRNKWSRLGAPAAAAWRAWPEHRDACTQNGPQGPLPGRGRELCGQSLTVVMKAAATSVISLSRAFVQQIQIGPLTTR